MKKIITKNAPLFATAVLALSTLFTASHASAAPTVKSSNIHDIKLQTTIASNDFYVKPLDNNMDARNIAFNDQKKIFSPLRINYQFKNTEGAIQAQLALSATLDNVEASGKTIKLKVAIGDKEIPNNGISQEVVNKNDAAKGITREIIISLDDKNPIAVRYEGTISIIFEAMTGV